MPVIVSSGRKATKKTAMVFSAIVGLTALLVLMAGFYEQDFIDHSVVLSGKVIAHKQQATKPTLQPVIEVIGTDGIVRTINGPSVNLEWIQAIGSTIAVRQYRSNPTRLRVMREQNVMLWALAVAAFLLLFAVVVFRSVNTVKPDS